MPWPGSRKCPLGAAVISEDKKKAGVKTTDELLAL